MDKLLMRFCYLSQIILFYTCSSSNGGSGFSICVQNSDSRSVVDFRWNHVNNLPKTDGEWVKIEGYFVYGFENVAIYPSLHAPSTEAIRINFRREIEMQEDKLQSLARKKVAVFGKFDANVVQPRFFRAIVDSVYCIQELQ